MAQSIKNQKSCQRKSVEDLKRIVINGSLLHAAARYELKSRGVVKIEHMGSEIIL